LFDGFLAEGRLLFLCDALNEMRDYSAESLPVRHLREGIERFGEDPQTPSQPPKCRFVFTCRTENYQVSLPAYRVDVERLDDKGIAAMAARYLGADQADAFLGALRARGVWD